MRLMVPLKTEKACLKCHEKQGYKEGEIRGGISSSMPLTPFLTAFRSSLLDEMIVYGRDITDRVRDEEALKQSEEKLRAFYERSQQYFNVAAVMLLVIDRDQTVSLINRRRHGR